MTATLVGVIYGTVSGRHLGTIIPGDEVGDAWLDDPARLSPGQSMVKVAKADLPVHPNGKPNLYIETLAAAIAAKGGPVILPAAPCVVVDANSNIVDRLMADPVLYQAPKAVTPTMTAALGAVNATLQAAIVPVGPFSVVQHDTAAIGGKLSNGVYTAPVLAVAAVLPDVPL